MPRAAVAGAASICENPATTSHDTLSDVLRFVRLRSAVYFLVSGEGRWAAEAPAACEISDAVMPEAEHVIEYHVVTAGDCWAAIVGEPPVRLQRGDLVMLPHGDAHVVSSAPGMRADPQVSWYHELKQQERPFRVTRGVATTRPAKRDGGRRAVPAEAATTLVCGFIGCDLRPFNPLIATLPRLLHLPAGDGSAIGDQFLELAVAESLDRRPGSQALLERMSEMMFVDAIRRYAERLSEESTGWLAGLRDRIVGRALTLLHATPGAAWTVDELSRQVGLSRSALHERFVTLVGTAPMQYLANWRMQMASRLLRETQASVASVALDVGYDSEAAFARAFKRTVGLPPAAWRRAQNARGINRALP